MFNNFFSKILHFMRYCRKKYSRAGLATDDNTAHAHFTLGTKVYKHTLAMCNTYCFSSTTMVARTRLNVTF